mgnify:CR=1 FL=1
MNEKLTALARALREKRIAGYAADVLTVEPQREDSPFTGLKNCILTPHIAGSYGDEVKRMGEYQLDEFQKFIAGEKTDYEVTIKMLETMA